MGKKLFTVMVIATHGKHISIVPIQPRRKKKERKQKQNEPD